MTDLHATLEAVRALTAPSREVLQRFWAKVQPEPNTGCWLWVGATVPDGYGQMYLDGKPSPAHRIAYELHKEPIPDGLQLDHLCRVRSCVNPDHLEPVTNRENIKRGNAGKREKDRTHCPQGHPYSGRNLVVMKGKRYCRECRRIASNKRYYRRKERHEAAARTAAALAAKIKEGDG